MLFRSVSTFDENVIKSFFFSNINVETWVTSPNHGNLNKLTVLKKAVESGIDVPKTIVCSTKQELRRFIEDNNIVITKDLTIPYLFLFEHEAAASKTIIVNSSFLDKMPDIFKPSLFQRLVIKEYEIRSFYFDNKFYSMAIFSQLDDETKIDFRNYNQNKPNRFVPYKLPNELEMKLETLMKKMSLFSGSIDLIKEKNGGYIFLEINPVGQFGMTSLPCNYYLEKIIASYLITENEK